MLEVPRESIDLDTALGYLAAHDLGVHLDIKLPGYETDVVAAVRRHGFANRVVFSTAFASTSQLLKELAPELPRAIGYPRDRLGVARAPWPAPLTRAGAAALRLAMPIRVPLLLRVAQANVLSLHHALCSRGAVAAAHRRRAPVLAWTVNDPAIVRRLAAIGVDAIVSDDPEMALATLLKQ